MRCIQASFLPFISAVFRNGIIDLDHVAFVGVYYHGIPVFPQTFEAAGIFLVDMSVDHIVGVIFLHQVHKGLKSSVGDVLLIADTSCGRMGHQDIKAARSPKLQGKPLCTAAHLRFRVLIGSRAVPHGAAKSHDPHALAAIDLIFDAEASLGRGFFVAFIVISADIEHRCTGKTGEKGQVFRRQISAGDQDIHLHQ